MNYDIVLFDVDNTLIDFELSEKKSIERTFEKHGLLFHEELFNRYKEINAQLWKDFELGMIAKSDLLLLRFEKVFNEYQLKGDISAVNSDYQMALGTHVSLTPNAIEVCEEVLKHCKGAIVTNGTITAQKNKLEKTGLDKMFSHIFISDELQYSKPDLRFFNHVFKELDVTDKNRVLIIGDSLGSDIKGGNNAGIATCWYNPKGFEATDDVKIDHEIKDLMELRSIILNR